MTTADAINFILSCVAIGVSIYALKVAKTREVERIDYELAKNVLRALERLNESLELGASAIREAMKDLEDSALHARIEWGDGFEHLVGRLHTLAHLYADRREAGHKITDELWDDLQQRSNDVYRFASEKIKAFRGKMSGEREN